MSFINSEIWTTTGQGRGPYDLRHRSGGHSLTRRSLPEDGAFWRGCNHTAFARMRRAMEAQASEEWKTRYRTDRPIVERKIAHFTRRAWGWRKARVRGLERIKTDVAARAGASTGPAWPCWVCNPPRPAGPWAESGR